MDLSYRNPWRGSTRRQDSGRFRIGAVQQHMVFLQYSRDRGPGAWVGTGFRFLLFAVRRARIPDADIRAGQTTTRLLSTLIRVQWQRSSGNAELRFREVVVLFPVSGSHSPRTGGKGEQGDVVRIPLRAGRREWWQSISRNHRSTCRRPNQWSCSSADGPGRQVCSQRRCAPGST